MKTLLTILAMILIISVIGCSNQAPESTIQTNIVEVTKEIEVTREVDVTRIIEITEVIEITKQIDVTNVIMVTPTTPAVTPTSISPSSEEQTSTYSSTNFIGSNEFPDLPIGEEGTISVIAVGPYTGSSLPIIVRNNTDESVIRIAASTVARSEDGSMLASAGDQGFKPNLVYPGEISLGYIYFGSSTDLPDNVNFEFEITAESTDSDYPEFDYIRDLEVIEQNLVDTRVVGFLKNPYDITVNGPIEVYVFCFNDSGELADYAWDFTDKDSVEPEGTVPYQVDLYDRLCPIYLVAASGWE